jgi:hypothetical protein
MDNLDEFMQHKFNSDDLSDRFVFQEAYWEQAERLIVASEAAKKKRRMILFWWLGTGLFLAISAVGFWQTGLELWRKTPAKASIEYAVSNPPINAATPHGSMDMAGSLNTEAQVTDKQVVSEIPPVYSSKNTIKNSKSIRLISEKKESIGIAQFHDSNVSADLPSNPSSVNPGIAPTSGSWAMAFGSPIQAESPMQPETAIKEDRPEIIQLAALPSLLKPVQIEVQQSPGPSKVVPLVDGLAEQVFQPRAIRKGLEAALTFLPTGEQGSRWGLNLAGFAEFPIKKHWSLQAGIAYRLQPIINSTSETLDSSAAFADNSNKVAQTVSYTYSFGYTLKSTERFATALHYINVPIAIQWRQRAISVRAGLSPGFLFASTQNIKQTTESSLQSAQSTANRRIQFGTLQNYRSFVLSSFVAAEYNLAGAWSVFVQPQYQLNNPLKQASAKFGKGGLWSVDLGVRYIF